jgi:hypothetical protein
VNETENKMTEDLFHSRLDLSELLSIYSDLHKDVVGVRPRFEDHHDYPQGRAEVVRWIENLMQHS